MIERKNEHRVTGALLVGGAILLVAGNIAHPIDADPSPTSRLGLASDGIWILIHLTLAVGFLLLTVGLSGAARHLHHIGGSSWAAAASTAAGIGGAVLIVVFGALDGYAVSALATSQAAPELIDAAAIAEEAIDSGLAALGTLLFFGVSLGAIGAAISTTRAVPRWLGWAAIVIGGVGTVAGLVLLIEGPTPTSINVFLRPTAMAGTVWFLAFGLAWRKLGDAFGGTTESARHRTPLSA